MAPAYKPDNRSRGVSSMGRDGMGGSRGVIGEDVIILRTRPLLGRESSNNRVGRDDTSRSGWSRLRFLLLVAIPIGMANSWGDAFDLV